MDFFEHISTSINSAVLQLSESLSAKGATSLSAQYLVLACVAVLLVLIVFAVAMLLTLASNTRKQTKKFVEATDYIYATGTIDEQNVSEINVFVQEMPKPINDGWANFLEQKIGYPSDYLSEEAVFSEKQFSSKFRVGSTILSTLSLILILLVAYIGAALSATTVRGELMKDGIIGYILFDMLAVVILPIIVYLICYAIIMAVYRAQVKKGIRVFREFENVLDDNVMIFVEKPEEEDLPASIEKIDVLDEEIEKIIANKIEQNELIEIVTTPRISQQEEVAAAAMPEEVDVSSATYVDDIELDQSEVDQIPLPTPATIFDDAPDVAPLPSAPTAEEIAAAKATEASHLQELVNIVEEAVADVRGTTKEDLNELAVMIKNAKQNGFPDEKDQQVLEECLYKLLDLYYR